MDPVEKELKPTRVVYWDTFIGGDADGRPVPREAFSKPICFSIAKTQLREANPGEKLPPVEEDRYELRKTTIGDTKLYIAAFVCTSFEGDFLELIWERLIKEVVPMVADLTEVPAPKNPGKPTKFNAGA